VLPKRSYPVTGWHEEPINKKHDQEVFDCGEAPLNDFLRRYARRSHELGGAKTFLAIDDADDKTILGFYSLSPASVDYARTPEIIRRGWHDTTFRASALRAWPCIAECNGRASADNFCWRRAGAASRPRRKLAAWLWRGAAVGRAVILAAAARNNRDGAQESRKILI